MMIVTVVIVLVQKIILGIIVLLFTLPALPFRRYGLECLGSDGLPLDIFNAVQVKIYNLAKRWP